MKINTTYFKLKERYIYGSSRVGVRNSDLDVLPLVTQNYAMHSVGYAIGSRTYELSNHLGNVLSVISDKLVPGGGKVIQSNDFSTSFSPYVSGGGSTLSISGGRLSVANASLYSNANIASLATVAGKTYRVTFTADLNGAGQITAHAYDPALATFLSVSPCNSNGTYYLDFLAISSTTRITFESSVTGPRTFYLDNVSIKELNAISSNNFSSTYTPFSPSGSASLSVSGNRLQVSNAGFSHNAHTSTINTVEGKAYRVSFQVDLASSGAISVYAADNTSTGYLNYSTCTVNGLYYLDFTANSASTMIAFESNVVGPRTFYIDNFVLHELPSSSIGTYSNGFGSSVSPFSATGSATAAISGGRMRVQNMGLWENVNASVSTVAGHVYKLWFNIDLAGSGNANAFVRDVATSTNLNVTLISANTGNGIQSIQFTATGVNTLIAFENLVAGPRTLYLDNIWMQDLNAVENAENILLADIRVAQDYSPFGVTLDGRNFVVDEGYRYGFQGQEGDDEIKGAGNSYNYTYRMHDPRIGRFFAVDPLANEFPHYSPYSFSGNRVIDAYELEGLEAADAKKGANTLVIVILGYDYEPAKGKTLARNHPDKTGDISEYTNEVGLTSIEATFKDNMFVQVVTYSSADAENTTISDAAKTMHMFLKENPNGVIVLVGHSLGADNIINIARNNPDIPIQLMYTIDICDEWDDDNVSENVNQVINVYQNGSTLGGEDVEADNPEKTKVTNHKAKEMNVTHTNVDNFYAKKVIYRIQKIINRNIDSPIPQSGPPDPNKNIG